jgi:DNA-3-methyladenine glycosylase
MFLRAGSLYVYRSYGIHTCANVVTGDEGSAAAVLLRAVAPLEGLAAIRLARPGVRRDRDLTSGPGRLCQALGVLLEHDGLDLFDRSAPVRLEGLRGPGGPVSRSTRIGISRAADRPWRFWLEGDPYVSAHRRPLPPEAT